MAYDEADAEAYEMAELDRLSMLDTGRPYIHWESRDGKRWLVVGGVPKASYDSKTGRVANIPK